MSPRYKFSVNIFQDISGLAASLDTSDKLAQRFGASAFQYKCIMSSYEAFSFDLVSINDPFTAAFGTLRKGRLNRHLTLTLADEISEPETFWDGIAGFARRHGVTKIGIESLGTPRAEIPAFPDEVARDSAATYVVPLTESMSAAMARNHLRNIKTAQAQGIELARQPEHIAIREHVALWNSSMQRRASRGERIASSLNSEMVECYLGSGEGRLFQAQAAGETLSSMLIVKIGNTAFYDTGGTSERGMKAGASYLLASKIMQIMRDLGCRSLNLGATSPKLTGLIRFKMGFGSVPWEFEVEDRRFNSVLGAALSRAFSVFGANQP
jgi:hypothetical protein